MSIKIDDIDFSKWNDKRIQKNHPLMPKNCFRMIIAGGSGSGKTVLTVNMILKYLNYDRLHIFAPSISQPAYRMLAETFEQLDDERKEIVRKYNDNHKRHMKQPEPIATFSDSLDDFKLDDLNQGEQHLIILDDMILSKQNPMIELFVRGRHRCASIMYLTQSYYTVPKIIRQNATAVILMNPTTKRELTLLHRDVGSGVELRPFVKTIEEALDEPYSFIKIDVATGDKKKRMTKGFDERLIFN